MTTFVAILILLFLVYMHIETRMLSVTKQKMGNGFENFKIAFMSDIHIGRMFVSWKRVKQEIERHQPDFIALTGDYIERVKQVDKFVKFLEVINPNKIPVFVVWGNHDYKAMLDDGGQLEDFKQKLTQIGVEVLDNQCRVFEKDGKQIRCIGLPDMYYGKPDVEKAFQSVKKDEVVLVLSHNPEIFYRIVDRAFDLLLSGHFHGAQIYTPFAIEFRSLRKESIWKKGVIRGLHQLSERKIYVSRGLGNIFLPMRFLSKPELTILE